MSVVVVGLNHRSTPLEFLERVSVAPGELAKALHDLAGREHVTEAAVLSTCNRIEIYAVVTRFHGAMVDLRNFLSDWSGDPPEAFADDLYSYHDEVAVSHLFRVASGLDSAVLGEGEILRQVRDAGSASRAEGVSGPVLDLLFRVAVETGKRVRTETAIAQGVTSLAHAAVAVAGPLDGRVVGVLGAGEIGTKLVAALAGHPFVVANRTDAAAVHLATRFGGEAVAWASLPDLLRRVDVLLTSTGSVTPLLGPAELASAVAGRRMLIVDSAMPRDVDPTARDIEGITLLDMDDVRAHAESAVAGRRAQLPRAEAIVAEEVERYGDAAAERRLAPVLGLLHDRAEEIRQAELARLGGRLSTLDDRQLRAVESLTRGIVNKVLHDPTVRLKAAAGTPQGEQLAAALRQLFGL